jgi:oxygen-dependent protoporphyrinogen oxidase
MAADVIQLVGLRGALRAQLDSLIPGPVGGSEKFLGPLVRKRMGRRVLDRLVTPVAAGVHSRHPGELEIDRVVPGLRHAMRQNESLAKAVLALRASAPRDSAAPGSNVAGLRGGVHRLAAELKSDVLAFGGEIRFGTTVATTDSDGVTTESGERISARHRVFTSAASTGGTPVVLATLVLDHPSLDTAPRGTGLLVEAGPTVTAKALTHATAKWGWLAEGLPAHRHVLRLSYDAGRVHAELEGLARADAATLLGVDVPADAVAGFARADWVTAPDATPVAGGVVAIGEAVAGVGLASVIGQARQEAACVLNELSELADTDTPPEDD